MRYSKMGVLLLVGSLVMFGGCDEKGEISFDSDTAGETTYNGQPAHSEQAVQQEKILVYVCGAVAQPGVIEVDADSRVVDVIALAGGMTEDADETYLNLAGRLNDGEKIYVPTREEVLQWESQEQGTSLININTATSDRLCELPGIGESKAADIIAYREKHGPFEAAEDIIKVPGIKLSLYERIADKISVK